MTNDPHADAVRLQKFLARAGVASRRRCEELIASGRVSVNGSVVRKLGVKVDPATDEVLFDGEVVRPLDSGSVIMLNKPTGYLTAMHDDRGRRCVSELVPVDGIPGLFPVGRLDKDTTGLLLFTNDGELGHGLLHPSHEVWKRYRAEVEGELTEEDIRHLEGGVMLEDGMAAPARCRVLAEDGSTSSIELSIHEGRKRQVRRMLAALGHPVIRLHREAVGPIALGDLERGTYRELTAAEITALKAAAL